MWQVEGMKRCVRPPDMHILYLSLARASAGMAAVRVSGCPPRLGSYSYRRMALAVKRPELVANTVAYSSADVCY